LQELAASVEHKPRLLVSVVTLGEIEFGHRVQVGAYAEHNRERMKFVNDELPDRLDLTEDAVVTYAEIRSRLFNEYAPGDKRKPKMRPEQLVDPISSLNLQIQENDLWLCAQAAAHQMVLVTNDAMTPIMKVATGLDPPLLVQNWTTPGALILL